MAVNTSDIPRLVKPAGICRVTIPIVAPIASACAQSLHPPERMNRDLPGGWPMRAEIQKIVDEIKQSVGLLRRHL